MVNNAANPSHRRLRRSWQPQLLEPLAEAGLLLDAQPSDPADSAQLLAAASVSDSLRAAPTLPRPVAGGLAGAGNGPGQPPGAAGSGFALVVAVGVEAPPPTRLRIQGTGRSEVLVGQAGNDSLNGGFGFDVLNGGAGRDTLVGGGGRDQLSGGAGPDRFLFDSPLSAATNIDTILDFSPGEDLIVLDRAIFTTLNPGRRLAGTALRAGAGVVRATTADERLLYDTSTGTLAYDADGSGLIDSPVPFAILANRPALSSGDVVLQGPPPTAPRTDPRPTLQVGAKNVVTVIPALGGPTPSVAWGWVSAATEAVSSGSVKLDDRIGPTIGARFYAMLGTAIYEAWQLFDRQASSSLSPQNGPERWDLDLERQIHSFLRSRADGPHAAVPSDGDDVAASSPLASRLIDTVIARVTHAVLSSPLSGLQAGSAGMARIDQQLQATLSALTPAQLAQFQGLDAQISAAVAQRVLDGFRNDGSSLTLPSLTNPITLNAPAYGPLNNSPTAVQRIECWTPEYGVNANTSTPLQSYLTPFWGDVQYYLLPAADLEEFTANAQAPEPFLLDPNDTYNLQLGLLYDNGQGAGVPITPALIGTMINPAFIAQANDVVAYSRQLAGPDGNLYKGIAQFWENGASTPYPPGTWMAFAQYASLLHDNSLADDAKLFLGLGASVYSASIAAWDLKRQYDYARPIRVVRELSRLGLMEDSDNNPSNGSQFEAYVRGQGLRLINGVDWETYQSVGPYSPPFPEFVSGHSTFSAAAADFLTNFYGSPEFGGQVQFQLGFSYDQPGQTVSLAWDTWMGAAQEAGFSRLWGGIHFLDGNLEGQALGSAIGSRVHDQLQHLWS
jgi:membrane-associated phospholipid phosphatase